jgi:RNA polymerase sigma-70 factor (ECF subfamily)
MHYNPGSIPFQLPGPRMHFPSTSWDLLAAAARRDARSESAMTAFAERYYAAVRAFILAVTRRPDDADDLTQRFFETIVLSSRLLPKADPARGRFRAYLKQAIRNFLVDEFRRDARAHAPIDALDLAAPPDLLDAAAGADEALLREWARSLVTMAVKRVEAECEASGQRQNFDLFRRRYLADPGELLSWREVGKPFGLDEKTARSRAETAARRFRSALRELIASDLGTGREVDSELRAVIALL